MTDNKQGYTASQEEINGWKKKHGSVFMIEVEDKRAYLKAPGRNELSYASTVGKADAFKFNAAILDKCWLAGDDEIRTDDRLFMGTCQKLEQVIETAEATIKKL